MNSVIPREMQHLLSGLCDGELTESELARLEELLSEGPECRRYYLEFMDMHSQLHLIAQRGGFQPNPSRNGTPSANAPSALPSSPATTGVKSDRVARYYQHFLVALSTMAVCILVQLYWPQPSQPDRVDFAQARPLRAAAKVEPIPFVATLRGLIDCVWENPADTLTVGTRLEAGQFRIPKGVANLQFDSGPELVVEGPAELRLESNSAVTVLSGKVVLRADESAAPFDLYTPTSAVAETGTEFAVFVAKESEEIHVFQGEVHRKANAGAKGAEPEHLKAGDARLYETKASSFGKPTPCDPKRFVRNVAPPAFGTIDPNAALLCYEGFDYRSSAGMTSNKSTGGKGWIGPWKPGFTRTFGEPERPRFPLNSVDGLARFDAGKLPIGGSFEFAGFTTGWRRMARPVRLDADGTYYVSFLCQRQGPPSDPVSAVAVQFWTHDDYQTQKFEDARQRLFIGVKKANQIVARHQRMDAQTSIGMNDGATYLLTAKIAASRFRSDRLYVHVYGPDDAVDSAEPMKWTLQSPPFHSDQVFDWLQLHINSKTRQTIDEIRVGTNWASVTSPYLKKT